MEIPINMTTDPLACGWCGSTVPHRMERGNNGKIRYRCMNCKLETVL